MNSVRVIPSYIVSLIQYKSYRWQIYGEKMEIVTDFIFLGSKITADGDCSHEIKRHLAPWKESYDNLDRVLKGRNITLLTKACIVKDCISNSHVWMWELDHKEVWVPKNWYIWNVVLDKTLESPLACNDIKRKSIESILKEINPEYSLEALMVKLKLQFFGHLIRRANSLEKDLETGKDWRQKEKEGSRGWDG